MPREISVGLVGATGAVGDVFLECFAARNFPLKELRLFATSRSAGKEIKFRGETLTVLETTPEGLRGLDVAIVSATSAVSRELCPIARALGCVVFDDSAVWRMDPSVPLVVPEINGAALRNHKGIIATPNCSTVPVVLTIAPLMKQRKVRRIIADTYQAVSGTGKAAVDELREQSRALLAGESVTARVYPKQIGFNVLPQVDSFLDDGYTKEEWKMIHESRKILQLPELQMSATCVRVPTYYSHAVSVHAEFDAPLSIEEVRRLWAGQAGVEVIDDPAHSGYPTPVQSSGRDAVFVGRARTDASNPNGIAYWAVTDNLRKGAALNIVQMMEWMLQDGCL